MIFAAGFSERSRHAFCAVIVGSGRHDLLFDARAFPLTSFEMQCTSFPLNMGFRLFNFIQSASWIRILINDFLLVRECDDSYNVLSRDNYRLTRFCVSHYQSSVVQTLDSAIQRIA